MEIRINNRKNLAVVDLVGKFDIRHSKVYEEQLAKTLKGKPPVLGINLSKVDYMDSSAIGAIIRTNTTLKEFDGELVLFGMIPSVLKIFKIARLDSYFRILSLEEFQEEFQEEFEEE